MKNYELKRFMRSIWEGSISFGLINIPVRLYTAVREKKLAFKYLRKEDLCQIKYVRVCKTTGEEVPYEEIVKGFEYEKGEFVVLDDEDFKKADVRKTHSIEVFQFAAEEEIDNDFFEKPYYLEPTKEAGKAYALLRSALKKSGKVGVAKFVLRAREKLAVIKQKGDMIILQQIRFADEIVDSEDLIIPKVLRGQQNELEIAVKLIEQLSAPFEIEKYHDTYTEALEKVIDQKSKGKVPKAKGKIPMPVTEMEDIMVKLRESLENAQKHK